MSELTRATIIPFLNDIFDRRGADEYLGEPVTIGEHMLQAAHFAKADKHSEEVVTAALLHDVGHFTGEFIGMPLVSGTVFMGTPPTASTRMPVPPCWPRFSRTLWWIAAAITSRRSAISARVNKGISTPSPKRRSTR